MASTIDKPAFCTLGMFILDKIEYLDSKQQTQENILGGAGTYAALGARLAAGQNHAHQVSWIVDMGSDFPAEAQQQIETWNTNCIFRLDKTRLTTVAWNGYGENEYRAFKYLTPKLRLEERDLSDAQVLAASFHMVCSPARCITLVRGILERRAILLDKQRTSADGGEHETRPVIVWEPVPDLCTPEELSRMREAAQYVDVVSPNAGEFASFFTEVSDLNTRASQVQWLLGSNRREVEGSKSILVIREGAHGCTTYRSSNLGGLHLHAYHQSKHKVIDPTGGGNTFLGALAIGLTGRTTPGQESLMVLDILEGERRLLLAVIHATIAAGYAIEQVGMPTVSASDDDCWNGESYTDRFAEYLGREQEHIASQLNKNKMIP